MKRSVTLFFVLLALCACSHKEQAELEYVSVLFEINSTKSAFEDDSAVSSLDVVVFHKNDGSLYTHKRSLSITGLVLSLPADTAFDYFVFGNVPSGTFDAVSNESELKNIFADLSDCVPCNGLPLTGSGSGSFSTSGTVSVTISHLASKIQLCGITPGFMAEEHYESKSVSLDRIYLINAVRNFPLTSISAFDTLWVNKLSFDEGLEQPLRPVLLETPGKPLKNSSTLTDQYNFYCMPNRTDNGVNSVDAPLWCARNTRLVLEITINGVKNYYPVTLPALDNGKCYRIDNLILQGEGSDHPDIPVSRKKITYSVTVSDWTEAEPVSEKF